MLRGSSNVNGKNLSEASLGFEDLNNYALLDIFDTLECEELLHLADANSRFRELITRYHMKNKFHIHERTLKIGVDSKDGLFNGTKIEFGNDTMIINDHVVLIRLFRNFGHLISRISFRQPENSTTNSSVWCDRVLGYINEYCAESLQEIMFFDGNFSITKLRKPFKQLHTVLIDAESLFDEIYENNLTEIFPSLQYFGIRNPHNIQKEGFAQHFPHLTDVSFPGEITRTRNNSKDHEFYNNLFDLNPQIRNVVSLYIYDFDLFRVTSEKMQNLETLNLMFEMSRDYVPRNVTPIHFKNVKKSYIQFCGFQGHNSIVFDQLEEMDFVCDANFDGTSFITKHRKLKVLNKWNAQINYEQYMSIIENLPDLIEISSFIWYADLIGHDVLQNVMQTETNLKKITFFTDSVEHAERLYRFALIIRWKIESDVAFPPKNRFMSDRFKLNTEYFRLSELRKITFVPM